MSEDKEDETAFEGIEEVEEIVAERVDQVQMLSLILHLGRWGGSKIGVGGVKLAMTEKGAPGGEPGCAMRREVKWRDGLWIGERGNRGRIPVAVSPTRWSKQDI